MAANISSKAIAGTSLANLAIQAGNIVTGILAARLLQPLGRGELATIILWPSIIESVGLMGIDWVLARKAATEPEDHILERTAVFLGLVVGLMVLLIGFYLLPLLFPNDKRHLMGLTQIYLLTIPLSYVSANLLGLDKGRMCWTRFNWVRLSHTITYLIFIIAIGVMGVSTVKWFVLALLMSAFFRASVQVLLNIKKIFLGRHRVKEVLNRSWNTIRGAYPFFAGIVSSVVSQQIDKALVVILLPMEKVGYYAVALTFASAHTSLRSAVGVTSFSALANELDRERQGAILAQIFRQSIWLMLMAGIGVACLAFFLITPLFGSAFVPAILPALALCLGTSLLGLYDILNESMWGMGITYPGIAANLIGVGLVVLIAWYFVPQFGLLGMAGAVALASLGRLLILIIAACFLLKLSPEHFWGLNLNELKIFWARVISLIPNYKRV